MSWAIEFGSKEYKDIRVKHNKLDIHLILFEKEIFFLKIIIIKEAILIFANWM